MLVNDIKNLLRISSSNSAFDLEINDLIETARQELILSGVSSEKADSETDPLIKRAVSVYVKANFGWDNPDSDKLNNSFNMLKNHLSLSIEYTEGDV
ncbi:MULTISPECIES: head-tail connector protein [Bacillaceae]|uniref:Head-tail connector protein n=1 Tax=Evansella alkalicola TaxID=745819 RepID=A0ABS6K084_9BACI|nr:MULTISPECIES: head-tail connector protein [Bacillaceae]MBU9724128.1 head-tail connector protein [Bacillus alkalicola]